MEVGEVEMKTKLVYILQVSLIALLAVVIISNLRARAQANNVTPTPVPASVNNPQSLLPTIVFVPLTPDAIIPVLPGGFVETEGVIVVHSAEALATIMTQQPEAAAIYFYPSTLDEVEPEWLQGQYEEGKALIALNVPLSVLGDKLGVLPEIEDLRMEYAKGRVAVAMFHARFNEDGTWRYKNQYTDFYNNLEQLLPRIDHTLRQAEVEVSTEDATRQEGNPAP